MRDKTMLVWIFVLSAFWLYIGLEKLYFSNGLWGTLGLPPILFLALSAGAFMFGIVYYLYHTRISKRETYTSDGKRL